MPEAGAKIGWIGIGRMGYPMVERLLVASDRHEAGNPAGSRVRLASRLASGAQAHRRFASTNS